MVVPGDRLDLEVEIRREIRNMTLTISGCPGQ